ncbi:MAG TPA: gliding motility protein GldN [Flavipsychrobacter sp.]
MKLRNTYITPVLLLLLAVNTVSAQTDTAETDVPVDGYYKHEVYKEAKPIPLPEVDRNNVRFYKRVYKDINLADSANSIFIMPGASLIEIVLEGIKSGAITAYDATSTKDNPTGDAFTRPLTYEQAMATLTDSVLVPVFDDEGNQVSARMMLNDFNPAVVTKFRIKEDIFYDNQRSRIETRIIGLAPLRKIDVADEMILEQPAFWLYYPQCRKYFVTKEVSDPRRDIYNVSLDDIFIQQSFASDIIKEANPADEKAKDPEKIEKEITEYKEETWKY